MADPPPAPDGSPKNGLSSEALRLNTLIRNKHALEILRQYPLNDAVFGIDGGHIRKMLMTAHSRAVMKEIVKCALNDSTVLKESEANQWRGQLGLCQNAQSEAGDWTTSPPTETCQELVTACILARVNGMKKAIPISLRGAPPELFPIRAAVPTEKRLRESPLDQDPSEGRFIPSFNHSPASCLQGECNWTPAYVGVCTSDKIEIADPDVSHCKDTTLRACSGIHGCAVSFNNSASSAQYPKPIESKAAACPNSPLKLDCQQVTSTGGYFSIMARRTPTTAQLGRQTLTTSKISGSGVYPATERQVFDFREGAFYGNLFDPAALSESWRTESASEICSDSSNDCCKLEDGCPIKGKLPYLKMYACYSFAQEQDSKDADKLGAAYLNSRICDLPDQPDQKSCFPHEPTRCYYGDPAKNAAEGAHCKWNAQAGVFQDCQGPGEPQSTASDPPHTYRPITVYLNDPCDLIDQDDLCQKVRKVNPPSQTLGPSLRPGATNPGPRGCGGCTSSGAPSVAGLAALAALALGRRRRPRAY